jgi:hypothetical protein
MNDSENPNNTVAEEGVDSQRMKIPQSDAGTVAEAGDATASALKPLNGKSSEDATDKGEDKGEGEDE